MGWLGWFSVTPVAKRGLASWLSAGIALRYKLIYQ